MEELWNRGQRASGPADDLGVGAQKDAEGGTTGEPDPFPNGPMVGRDWYAEQRASIRKQREEDDQKHEAWMARMELRHRERMAELRQQDSRPSRHSMGFREWVDLTWWGFQLCLSVVLALGSLIVVVWLAVWAITNAVAG